MLQPEKILLQSRSLQRRRLKYESKWSYHPELHVVYVCNSAQRREILFSRTSVRQSQTEGIDRITK